MLRLRPRDLWPGLAVAVGVAIAACSTELEISGGDVRPDADAAADADAAGADGSCQGSACPVTCPTVHVSSKEGDDASSGCDAARPKKTIASAIATAKSERAKEIRVCNGIYPERVVLDGPIALRGRYDCSTWTRTKAPGSDDAGVDAGPDAGLDDTIVKSLDDAFEETVLVTGAAADRAATLDGMHIRGPDRKVLSTKAVGVRVAGGASPKIADCTIYAGSGGTTTGLDVPNGSPDVTGCTIDGGHAVCTSGCGGTVVAQGVALAGGRPRISRTTISGGMAMPTVPNTIGSIALAIEGDVKAVDADAFSELDVVAGTATISAGDAVVTMRVRGSASQIDVRDSRFSAPTSSSCGDDCNGRGIVAEAGAKLRISRSRVACPDVTVGAGSTLDTSAVSAKDTGTELTIATSLVVGSNFAVGVAKGSVIVRASTLLAARLVAVAGGSFDFDSSLFAQTISGFEPFSLPLCYGTPKVTVASSAIVSPISELARVIKGGANCTGLLMETSHLTAGGTSTALASDGLALFDVSNLARYTSDCSSLNETSVTCVAVGQCVATVNTTRAHLPCINDVFTSYDAATLGRANIVGAGLALRGGAPCSIARGGRGLGASFATDLAGAARTDPFSAGAYEHDATCTP